MTEYITDLKEWAKEIQMHTEKTQVVPAELGGFFTEVLC